ncbi:hypothetical protein TNCT_372971 [Trichonephila clavata]|uniref:Uncharacterized protein n=1 Tax=Trichonephila clavata TaxID=2740835 RepID=A0A8X6HKR8_TRICU|nr:hypothetical protein TNCT_372971 [Trichonephila clavata]
MLFGIQDDANIPTTAPPSTDGGEQTPPTYKRTASLPHLHKHFPEFSIKNADCVGSLFLDPLKRFLFIWVLNVDLKIVNAKQVEGNTPEPVVFIMAFLLKFVIHRDFIITTFKST